MTSPNDVHADSVVAPATTLGVLMIGGDFLSLGVMRALAKESIPVFLLATERGIAGHSRFAGRRQQKYDLLSDPNAVDFLLKLAAEEHLEGWVIQVANDETVEFLSRHFDALSEVFQLPVPTWDVTKLFYEKDHGYRVAESAGIPIPAMYRSENLDELLSQELSFPIVLKPTFKKNYYDKTNDKAVLVNDRDELIQQYEVMNRLIPDSQILAQEFLAGGTQNLYSFAAVFDGQDVVQGMSAIRLRQHPMDFGHATTYAEVRDMPQLEALATQFLRALDGYRGVAEVEFMYDERSGQYKFIEMNGRFWGWHSLTLAAGLNYPASMFRMLVGQKVHRGSPNLDSKWMRVITDTPTALREIVMGRMSIGSYLQTIRGRRSYAVWSWRDPLPFFAEVLMSPYLWWKRGF